MGLGNALILQEQSSQSSPGISANPDDDASGGVFVIEPAGAPVFFLELDLIDICTANFGGARVELFDQTGLRRSCEVPGGFTEDIAVQGAPGFRTLDLRTLDPQQGYAAVATVMEDFGFDPFGIACLPPQPAHPRATMRRLPIYSLVLLPVVSAWSTQDERTSSSDPVAQFPKTWDEEALATLELPSALTGEPAKHVTAEFYYAIPARTIYRTYSVYAPGMGPEGHLESLLELEPEVVLGPGDSFEPYADWTEEEWVRAGAEVYRTPIQSFVFDPRMIPALMAQGAALGVPETADGRIPFRHAFVQEKGELRVGNLSCAQCHTRVMPDGTSIEGAQGNEPFDRAFALSLGGLGAEQGAAAVTELFGAPAKDGTPATVPAGIDGPALAAAHRAIPPGVIARHGTSSFSPVQVPDLIGLRERRYLDRTGLQRHRDIGDLMRYVALNQGLDRLSSWAGYVPEADSARAAHEAGLIDDEAVRAELASVTDPSGRQRYSDPQLYALAKYVYALESPENPNPRNALAHEGSVLFEAHCSTCHPAPLYTSNELVPAPGFEPPESVLATEDVRPRTVGTDPRLTLSTRRGTGFYKIPSLRGVWYRGPLSHDGSVATLEDWFDPRRLRDDYVPTGWNPGGGARAVRGHEYGLDFSESEREALIAFLRTL